MALTDLSQGVSGGSGIGINDLIDAEIVQYYTVTLADIANGYFSYAAPVGAAGKFKLCPMGGAPLQFGTDYTVNAGLSRVEWTGLTLDGLIAAGDTFRLVYNSPV